MHIPEEHIADRDVLDEADLATRGVLEGVLWMSTRGAQCTCCRKAIRTTKTGGMRGGISHLVKHTRLFAGFERTLRTSFVINGSRMWIEQQDMLHSTRRS